PVQGAAENNRSFPLGYLRPAVPCDRSIQAWAMIESAVPSQQTYPVENKDRCANRMVEPFEQYVESRPPASFRSRCEARKQSAHRARQLHGPAAVLRSLHSRQG